MFVLHSNHMSSAYRVSIPYWHLVQLFIDKTDDYFPFVHAHIKNAILLTWGTYVSCACDIFTSRVIAIRPSAI